MSSPSLPAPVGLFFICTLCSFANAQVFVNATSSFPSGAVGYTENVDFGDLDGDGDFDVALADGGDFGEQQNRLWINRGSEPGGTVGVFVDRTTTQFPLVIDASRDIEFADIDDDGDLDIYIANHSSYSNQTSRWWINAGGAQGGTEGFFVDDSAARWSGLGGAGSSIHPSQVLPNGFIAFSGDGDFGDLDNDGDLDLVASSYGPAFTANTPTRLFLNDGSGVFTEFNPSGFQLSGMPILNGNPGLWCEGTQLANTLNSTGVNCDIATSALDVDVGDIDGDLDLDILLGARQELPRMFRNLLFDGLLGFRDVTGVSFTSGYSIGNGHYEQEMGDCDNDGDLDIYGLNWQVSVGFNDATLTNDGTGFFANIQVLAGSTSDDNEVDFLDYDADGDLDAYVANFSGQDRLYRNDFSGAGFSHTNVTASTMPLANRIGLDADCADLDEDGDIDVMVANTGSQSAEYYFVNQLNTPETHAPRCTNLEQALDRAQSLAPTVVRVQVYDNASYYETWYCNVTLEYRVVPAAFVPVVMHASQGQIWRGEIPGFSGSGVLEYRVIATDRQGNVGTSVTKSFQVVDCNGAPVTYCTAGTTTNGCNATMSASGAPSATASNGFTLTVSNLEGQKSCMLFYGINGRQSAPWAPGSSSVVCVRLPTQRFPLMISGGTSGACDGSIGADWNAFMSSHPFALGQPLAVGQRINAQTWFRDPPAPGKTNLSDAIEFFVCP